MNTRTGYVDVHNASLWTECQGSGPAVVLCHGGPGMWDYLEPVADMIDDLDTAYRYDQRACGRSSGGPPFDVDTAVADLEALREHWDLPRWVVAGHSWGATLALAYCLEHPDRTVGLIYLSGTGVDAAWHAEYHRNQAALLGFEGRRQLTGLKARLPLTEGAEFAAVSRTLCDLVYATDIADRARARELVGSLFIDDLQPNYEVNSLLGKDGKRFAESGAIPKRLAALRVPALVVHGEADPRPVWAARKLAGLMPNASLRTLPATGHFPWLEQPGPFRETLRSFLTSVEPFESRWE